ncbi:hypothetical protein L1887_05118 [Cichorium endivia]|nr:hypothetical protein L1887_05118 [Cichorium endivia]
MLDKTIRLDSDSAPHMFDEMSQRKAGASSVLSYLISQPGVLLVLNAQALSKLSQSFHHEDYFAMASQIGLIILGSCEIIGALTRHSRATKDTGHGCCLCLRMVMEISSSQPLLQIPFECEWIKRVQGEDRWSRYTNLTLESLKKHISVVPKGIGKEFHLLDYMQELIDVDDAATIKRIANRLIFDQVLSS